MRITKEFGKECFDREEGADCIYCNDWLRHHRIAGEDQHYTRTKLSFDAHLNDTRLSRLLAKYAKIGLVA